MFKRLSTMVLASAAFLITFIASINAASACYYMHYEPEVPKSLRK
ncbi:MAG: AgrD protein [Clostridia bacterium]|nr:AgrD protein [Clostridia bacterium]